MNTHDLMVDTSALVVRRDVDDDDQHMKGTTPSFENSAVGRLKHYGSSTGSMSSLGSVSESLPHELIRSKDSYQKEVRRRKCIKEQNRRRKEKELYEKIASKFGLDMSSGLDYVTILDRVINFLKVDQMRKNPAAPRNIKTNDYSNMGGFYMQPTMQASVPYGFVNPMQYQVPSPHVFQPQHSLQDIRIQYPLMNNESTDVSSPTTYERRKDLSIDPLDDGNDTDPDSLASLASSTTPSSLMFTPTNCITPSSTRTLSSWFSPANILARQGSFGLGYNPSRESPKTDDILRAFLDSPVRKSTVDFGVSPMGGYQPQFFKF